MPRPTAEARIRRIMAVLDLYDHARAFPHYPSVEAVKRATSLESRDSCNAIADTIAERVLGPGAKRPPVVRVKAPANITPPEGLTPSEARIFEQLAKAHSYVSAADLMTGALGYDRPIDALTAVKGHITNLRKKGAIIKCRRNVGWLLMGVQS